MDLNQIWSQVKELERITKDVNEKYAELYENETWKPNLTSEFDIKKLVSKAKDGLVRKAVNLTLEKHGIRNIEIPENVFREFSEKEFDEKEIEERITKNYVENADRIAYEQILAKSKRLLPIRREQISVSDITKGRKLFLKVYWFYGSIHYESLEEVLALEKLINVIVLNENASKTSSNMAWIIDSFRRPLEDFSQARIYHYDNGIIKSFRIYKNGKFEIEFHQKDYAEEVAKALLDETIP